MVAIITYVALRIFNILHIENYMAPGFAIVWGGALSYAVLWFAYHGPSVLERFTGRIGDLSYSVYIWHMLVVNFAMYAAIADRWSAVPWAAPAFVIAVSFALAALSWHLVEKRALRRKAYFAAEPHQG